MGVGEGRVEIHPPYFAYRPLTPNLNLILTFNLTLTHTSNRNSQRLGVSFGDSAWWGRRWRASHR